GSPTQMLIHRVVARSERDPCLPGCQLARISSDQRSKSLYKERSSTLIFSEMLRVAGQSMTTTYREADREGRRARSTDLEVRCTYVLPLFDPVLRGWQFARISADPCSQPP